MAIVAFFFYLSFDLFSSEIFNEPLGPMTSGMNCLLFIDYNYCTGGTFNVHQVERRAALKNLGNNQCLSIVSSPKNKKKK